MKISRQVIADSGMVKLGAVHKAIQSGRLDPESLLSVVGYVISKRLAHGGVKAVTGISPDLKPLVEGGSRRMPQEGRVHDEYNQETEYE